MSKQEKYYNYHDRNRDHCGDKNCVHCRKTNKCNNSYGCNNCNCNCNNGCHCKSHCKPHHKHKHFRLFKAKLNGRNEVPPNNSRARGKAVALLSKDGKRLDYILQTKGLKNIVGAHFHLAPKGVDGPVVKNIDINHQTGVAVGSWTSADLIQPLTPELVKKLKRGKIYINVHTAEFPGGEIRGQLYFAKRR